LQIDLCQKNGSSQLPTVKALIKAPLKNNYDPQRHLVQSEKITSDP